MQELKFSEQIRKAVDDSGLSRYSICVSIGLDQGNFSKFMNGKGGLSIDVLDRLADHLGLRISTSKTSPRRKDG